MTASGRSEQFSRACVWLVLGVGLALRAGALAQPIGYDEAFTYQEFARHGPGHFLANYSHPNNHVLHTLGAWATTRLLGDAPWALRLGAFVAGVGLLPVLFVVVRRRFDADVALLALAWVGVAAPLVHYSASARGYALQALLIVFAIELAVRLREAPRRTTALALAAVSSLALFTIPTSLYVVAALSVWLAGESWRIEAPTLASPRWRCLVLALGLTAVTSVALYAPIWLGTGIEALFGNDYTRARPTPVFLSRLVAAPAAIAGFWTQQLPGLLGATWVLGLSLAVWLARHRAPRAFALGIVLALTTLLVVIVQHRVPPPRVFTFALPLMLVASAWGVVEAVRRWPPRRARSLVAVLALASALAGGAMQFAELVRRAGDEGRPDALAEWLLDDARRDVGTFAAPNILGHRVLHALARRGVEPVPTHRVGGFVVWQLDASVGAERGLHVLLDGSRRAALEEFVALLEGHEARRYAVEALPALGSVQLRRLVPRPTPPSTTPAAGSTSIRD